MIRSVLKTYREPIFLYAVCPSIFHAIIFFQPQLGFSLHILMLLWSYVLIIRKGSLVPVITLIIYARAFVGFSAASGPIGYTELNILTNYIPAVLYLFAGRRSLNFQEAVRNYHWVFIYGIILVLYSLLSGGAALLVLGDRLAPFFLLLIFLLRGVDDRQLQREFLPVMRYLVIATIVVSFSPSYLSLTLQYLESGTVFGEPSISSIYLGENLRGMGPFWDPRLLGTMCALYLAASLTSGSRSKLSVDSFFALAGVALSLSRGSMVLAAIVLFFALAGRITPAKAVLGLLGVVAVFIFGPIIFEKIINPIFIVNGLSAIDQRNEFFQFALSKFFENPLGSGVGTMRELSGGVYVLGNHYSAVTDAYIAILLSEIGIVGFIIFLLSFKQLIWGDSAVSKGLFIGFIVQMIGTDLGDFGMYFYVMLIVGGALRTDMPSPSRVPHRYSRSGEVNPGVAA